MSCTCYFLSSHNQLLSHLPSHIPSHPSNHIPSHLPSHIPSHFPSHPLMTFLKNRKSHYLHYEHFPQLSLINSLDGHYHLNLLRGTILRVWLEPLLYYHLHLLPSLLQHSPSVMLYNVLSNQWTTNCNKVSETVPECAMAVSSLCKPQQEAAVILYQVTHLTSNPHLQNDINKVP